HRCIGGACKCDPQSCPNGCCDQSGNCVAGGASNNAFCGKGGLACIDCTASGKTCINGACTGCTPANCPSGCCSGDSCLAGTSDLACGSNADACVQCPGGQRCDQGACICDGQSCPNGCCDANGNCQANGATNNAF